MGYMDCMRRMLDKTGKSYRALSVGMGKHPNYIRSVMDRQTLRVDTLDAISGVCGYELHLLSKDGTDDIRITSDENSEHEQ